MDLLAEYTAVYGRPDPRQGWPEFSGLVERTPRFQARARLQALEAATVAHSGGGRDLERRLQDIVEASLPGRRLPMRRHA